MVIPEGPSLNNNNSMGTVLILNLPEAGKLADFQETEAIIKNPGATILLSLCGRHLELEFRSLILVFPGVPEPIGLVICAPCSTYSRLSDRKVLYLNSYDNRSLDSGLTSFSSFHPRN